MRLSTCPSVRIAVTGATGYVGQALVRETAARKLNVRSILRAAAPASAPSDNNIVVGDIDLRTDWSEALSGVDCVIHCAARTHVMNDTAGNSSAGYHMVNVDGSRRLAEQAAASGVRRLVFVSSAKVSGERSELGRPLRVGDVPRPDGFYGVSKLEAELALEEVASATGLELVVVRPPLVYGPGVKGNFLRLLRLVERGVPLPLALVDNARSMVFLDNLVDFLCFCIFSPTAAGQTFFVSDGEDLSTAKLIRMLSEAMDRPDRLFPVPIPFLQLVGSMTRTSAEILRLIGSLQVDISPNRQIGWSPPVSVEIGVRETVRWFRSQQ